MRINQNNLEVKYSLEIYKELPDFPTKLDMVYVLIRTLEDQELLDKEFTADNVWGSLRTCIPNITEIRDFLDSISKDAQGEKPYLKQVKQDKRGGSYILIRNPWM